MASPGPADPQARLREPWVGGYLQRFIVGNGNLLSLRVLTPDGSGPRLAPADLPVQLVAALDTAFEEARAGDRPVWKFAVASAENEPVAALAIPVHDESGGDVFVVEALARLRLMEAVFEREATGRVAVFLIGSDGRMLWSEGADDSSRLALARSDLVRDFMRKPLLLTAQYSVATESGPVEMLGHVSPVEETGWGVVVHKPVEAAFEAARRMVISAVAGGLLLLAAAVVLAQVVSRKIGETIRRLTRTTHEIAAGNATEAACPGQSRTCGYAAQDGRCRAGPTGNVRIQHLAMNAMSDPSMTATREDTTI